MGCALLSKPPCKGCEDRHERCHTKCPDYIEWQKSRASEEKKARREFMNNKLINDYQLGKIEKNKKRR